MHFLQVMYQNAVTFYLKVTNKCSRQRHHSITILHNKNPSTFPKKYWQRIHDILLFSFTPPFFFFFSLNSRAKKETLEINTLTQSFSASTSSSFFSLMAASFFSTFSPASALDFGFSSSFLGSGRRMTFPIFWRSCMRFMASVTWEETGEQSRCSHWAVTERISHLNAAKNYLRVTKTPINTICCKVPRESHTNLATYGTTMTCSYLTKVLLFSANGCIFTHQADMEPHTHTHHNMYRVLCFGPVLCPLFLEGNHRLLQPSVSLHSFPAC